MAKYLDTAHISSELMSLLKEAKQSIILVTYSLQVNTQIQERLKTKSKLGTVGEIVLIFGNTKLKDSELEWMKEVTDLKVWQKKNLHAKCYVNENKAIISSMNLYDYSQTTNVEMGVLITKEDDEEAYLKLIEDIEDLRINGERIIEPWKTLKNENKDNSKETRVDKTDKSEKQDLSYLQQAQKVLLQNLRDYLSHAYRQKGSSILSDKNILDIIEMEKVTKGTLRKALGNDKKVKQIGDDIIDVMFDSNDYEFGKILDIKLQEDEFSYDQIKMLDLTTNTTKWYNTKRELPRKGEIVAVSINGNWFNKYFILNKSDVKSKPREKRDYSNSNYKTTKELSQLTDLSSRVINSALVEFGVMKKNGQDWEMTNKGKTFGGQEREGQYGKFIIWPEEIVDELEISELLPN